MNYSKIKSEIEEAKALYSDYILARDKMFDGARSLNIEVSDVPSREEYDFVVRLSSELTSNMVAAKVSLVKEIVESRWISHEKDEKKKRKSAMAALPKKSFWSMEDVIRGDLGGGDITVINRGNIVVESYVYARVSKDFMARASKYFLDIGVEINERYPYYAGEEMDLSGKVEAFFNDESFSHHIEVLEGMFGRQILSGYLNMPPISHLFADSFGSFKNYALLPLNCIPSGDMTGSLDFLCIGRYLGNEHFNFVDPNAVKVFDQSIGETYNFVGSSRKDTPSVKTKGAECIINDLIASCRKS